MNTWSSNYSDQHTHEKQVAVDLILTNSPRAPAEEKKERWSHYKHCSTTKKKILIIFLLGFDAETFLLSFSCTFVFFFWAETLSALSTLSWVQLRSCCMDAKFTGYFPLVVILMLPPLDYSTACTEGKNSGVFLPGTLMHSSSYNKWCQLRSK